jgi:hypothetical protein
MVCELAWQVTTAQLKHYCLGNRRQSVDGRHPEGSGYAFSVFASVLHQLMTTIDAMQQMASDINKIKRS